MYDPYAEFTKNVLSNGLEVHSVTWDRPWIGVVAVVHCGGREDPVSMPGLAHFVEHTVSQNIPNREFDRVKEFFETCGGRVEFGSTSFTSTIFKFSVPAELDTFREALKIFGSMLLSARIENEVERERKVILREFNQRYPFLEKLEWDLETRGALFKGHRLETWNRPLGRPEGFLSATEKDLQNFYDKYYVPRDMSLVIVGGLSTNEVITELAQSPFGEEKDGLRNQIPKPYIQLPVSTNRSRVVKMSDHVNFKIDQTEYLATWAFPINFPRQSLRVFNEVLKKILNNEIREKRGLAYSVGTNLKDFQDVYEYEIGGRISPEATQYIDKLVHECIEMVPTKRDLFDQKLKALKQMCLMVDLSGQTLAGNSADKLACTHRIISIQEEWDELHKVTFEQMAGAASHLTSERQYVFIARP